MAVLKIKDSNGEWQNIVAVKGDRGPEGPRGPAGPTGPVGGVASVNGALPDDNGNVSLVLGENIAFNKSNVTSALGYTPIAPTGARGNLAGYETTGSGSTINATSQDSNQTAENITVQNGSSGSSWTKIVRVTASVTVSLGGSWIWQGGVPPIIVPNGVLVLCWCGSGGIATFISPNE